MKLIFEDERSLKSLNYNESTLIEVNKYSRFTPDKWWCNELAEWFSTLIVDNVLLIKTDIYNYGLLKKIVREIEERYIAGDPSYDLAAKWRDFTCNKE